MRHCNRCNGPIYRNGLCFPHSRLPADRLNDMIAQADRELAEVLAGSPGEIGEKSSGRTAHSGRKWRPQYTPAFAHRGVHYAPHGMGDLRTSESEYGASQKGAVDSHTESVAA